MRVPSLGILVKTRGIKGSVLSLRVREQGEYFKGHFLIPGVRYPLYYLSESFKAHSEPLVGMGVG